VTLEQKLAGWTGPSSSTEQDKQDRTERMVRDTIKAHPAFAGCSLSVYAKGSYANNTNVRSDSDVDIAVQCHEVLYWEEWEPGARGNSAILNYDPTTRLVVVQRPNGSFWTGFRMSPEAMKNVIRSGSLGGG
jgi:hypothetical protein